MKKHNIYAIMSAALLVAAVSCTPDNPKVKSDSYISLSLSSKSMETKAAREGEDPFNENIINTVYYYFYKDGEESASPVVKGRLKGLDHRSGVRTEEIPVTTGTASTLFGSGDKCRAFIVANPPQGLETFLGGSPTLSQLRSELFLTDLDGIQESFTMIFDDQVSKEATTGNIMTVEANLRRLANKFTVSLNISGELGMPVEWQSIPADAKVEFHNAFKETALGGDFSIVKAGDSKFKEKVFSTGTIDFGDPEQVGDNWKCKIERPIYSYSISWDFVSGSEPYITIELPWKNASTEVVTPTYYKVFFSTKDLTINNWCHLNVNLDRLGGFQKDHPVQLFENMDYMVLDWNTAFEDGSGITTDIDGARYLMMNQTEYFLYNQDSWNFPYTSSHECEIVYESELYERKNYRGREAGTVSGNSHTLGGEDIYNCTVDGKLITFHHKLNNDFASIETIDEINYGNYDVVPYTFTFRIQHKDNSSYYQDVTVHQYPAIYIEAQPNDEGLTVVPGPSVNTTSFLNINPALVNNASGGSYVPGFETGETIKYYYYFGYGDDPHKLMTSGTVGNSNGNMYVITTAVAPVIDGVKYMLADPRQFENGISTVNGLQKDAVETMEESQGVFPTTPPSELFYVPVNAGDSGYPLAEEDDDIFEEADALVEGPRRTLKYYYPTIRTDEAENIIAPKLRVASSWGQCTMMSYDKAVRRCAAYQEDGYPAGRWRVPTAAEIKYIVKLSSDHVIPQLFGQFDKGRDFSANYWCSTGFVGVYKVEEKDGTLLNAYLPPQYTSGPENATERMAVRCVYDEWYWENRDYDNGTVSTEKGRLPEHLWRTRYWGDMSR